MNDYRIPRRARGVFGAVLAISLIAAPAAFAQTSADLDHRGNLIEMPFNLDVPVTRVTVQRSGENLAFQNFTSLTYDQSIAHYQAYYASQRDLAPGWRIIGYGFDVGADVYGFTLRHGSVQYRLDVLPDPHSGGSIVLLRGHARSLGYQPQQFSVAPYRASDVGRVPY